MSPYRDRLTLDEQAWDDQIVAEGLHLKHDTQLVAMRDSHDAKRAHAATDLLRVFSFPDSVRWELKKQDDLRIAELETDLKDHQETSKFSDTEIEAIVQFERDLQTNMIDVEMGEQQAYSNWKARRLREIVERCDKEIEFRADGKVERSPIGTTFYIDADNGNDSTNDGTTPTKSNGDGPWATLDKFAQAGRSAGDKAILRRGMTNRYDDGSDLVMVSDGTIDNPIIIEADYGDVWNDHVDLSVTATATLTFGSKTITFSADISGVLAAGDIIYVTAEDAKEFAYEVDTVVTTTVTLFLPYKGAQAGSGKAMTNMQSMPIWNTAAGNFQWNFDGDDFWLTQGVHIRGTDANGQVEIDSAEGHVFVDCVLEGNGVSDYGIRATDDGAQYVLIKCRTFNNQFGINNSIGTGWFHFAVCRDCLFDGNSVSSSEGVGSGAGSVISLIDTEFKANANADIVFSSPGSTVFGRNLILSSGLQVKNHANLSVFMARALLEDFDGTLGDTRQLTSLSEAQGTPIIQSDTGTVRSGGSNVSIKCTPSTRLGNVQGWEWSRQLLFEIPFYATTDSKTYEVYFRPTATADWTADPVADELWIEVEYWGHASNNYRRIVKSTGVIDMNGSTDWQALSVTVAPAQAGVLYLRCYYARTKEGGKDNTFFCDPIPVVS